MSKRFVWMWLLVAAFAASPASAYADDSAPGAGREIEYVMRPGESLEQVARMFRIPASELAARNGIADPLRLQVGQALRIPDPLVAEVAALSAERSALAEQLRRREAELTALRRESADSAQRLESALAEQAALETTVRSLADYRRDAFVLLAGLALLAGWGAWTLHDRNRLAERVAAFARECTLLGEARERYRTAVAQLELRFQRLHALRPAERERIAAEVLEGTAVLRRIFAEGSARIEAMLAARASERAEEPASVERVPAVMGPLRRLRLVGHRE